MYAERRITISLYVQRVGRAPILDHAGLVRMHGPVNAVTARTAAQVRSQLVGGAGGCVPSPALAAAP